MADRLSALLPGHLARIDLKIYSADLLLGTLTIGVDNIHYDVFLSPRFVDLTHTYLFELIRQTTGLAQELGREMRSHKASEAGTWKKQLAELLQASLNSSPNRARLDLQRMFSSTSATAW